MEEKIKNIEDLVGKNDNELKQFLKDVIVDRKEEFNWVDLLLKYYAIESNLHVYHQNLKLPFNTLIDLIFKKRQYRV